MSGNEYINMFSAHLFWDVRKEDVDLMSMPNTL